MGLSMHFITFNGYERLTARIWGICGCRCRQCSRSVHRVLEFSLAEDVKISLLERGARRALVGLSGEVGATPSARPCVRKSGVLYLVLGRGRPHRARFSCFPPSSPYQSWGIESNPGQIQSEIRFRQQEKQSTRLQQRMQKPVLIHTNGMEVVGVMFEDGERAE